MTDELRDKVENAVLSSMVDAMTQDKSYARDCAHYGLDGVGAMTHDTLARSFWRDDLGSMHPDIADALEAEGYLALNAWVEGERT
jgi:hypothetical protein